MWRNILFALIFGVGLTFSDIVAFEYVCDYPELGPKFYGFPFVYRTSTTWVNSMSGDLYLQGIISDTIFWFIIVYVLILGLKKLKNIKIKRVLRVIGLLIFGFSLFLTIISFLAIDWRLEISHDNFKINYYLNEIECNRTLKWME
jgi:hypothetical protein